MAHLGERSFDSIGGAVVSTTAFIFEHKRSPVQRGSFLRLTSGRSESEKSQMILDAIGGRGDSILFVANSETFEKIPGSPVAYWVSEKIVDLYEKSTTVSGRAKKGVTTGDNEKFVRFWHEVASEVLIATEN